MGLKTIHKLVLKSFIGPLVLTFFIVTFVLMMNFLWRYIDELTGKGLGADVIIELLFYATANILPMGLPLVMLFAGIMTLGNMGENYELLAMKSAGLSLVQILKPLIILVIGLSIGSFFIVNNLVPYANKQMNSILYDIKQQKQVLELQDGLFFNGIDENISIRAGHQNPETGLLTDVLIYNNASADGKMMTTVAESGYIRLSDDKRFLLITLFNGDSYQHTRNSGWYTQSAMRHDRFKVQEAKLAMEGFNFERRDNSDFFNGSQTKNLKELQYAIDSLDRRMNEASSKSYEPLMKDNIFTRDIQVLQLPDSLRIDKSDFRDAYLLDSIQSLSTREKSQIWSSARSTAVNSRNSLSFDESSAKVAMSQLYRSKNDWHYKLAIPFSLFIFFLIGAPLGAIIRRGGLGTPVVISVAFFVFYYIISINGRKAAEEGIWSSFSGMWLSSFILTPIAIYLIIKATNDSSLLDVEWYYAKYSIIKERTERIWSPIKARITATALWQKLSNIKRKKAKKQENEG